MTRKDKQDFVVKEMQTETNFLKITKRLLGGEKKDKIDEIHDGNCTLRKDKNIGLNRKQRT